MDKSLLADIPTKERSVNFKPVEMERLQTLIAKYKNILFCKKTDCISSKQKESAWNLIHSEFNALGDTPRTIKQLKYKFENLKRSAKKGASRERQEMRRTGGGTPASVPPEQGDATDWLRSIMPVCVDGNPPIYDDDVIITQNILFPANQPKGNKGEDDSDREDSQHGKKISVSETTIEVEDFAIKEKSEFDTSTTYSSLKRPVSSPLRRQAKKQKPGENCNLVRQLLREKKLSIMDELQEIELQKIKDSIKHAQEVHEQKLRHNEERHKLELEKLHLEIAILKKSDF